MQQDEMAEESNTEDTYQVKYTIYNDIPSITPDINNTIDNFSTKRQMDDYIKKEEKDEIKNRTRSVLKDVFFWIPWVLLLIVNVICKQNGITLGGIPTVLIMIIGWIPGIIRNRIKKQK